MGLREYIRLLRRSWFLLTLTVLLGLCGGLAYTLLQAPQYQATSQSFFWVQQGSSGQDLAQGGNYAQQVVGYYSSVVTSERVLDPVVEKLRDRLPPNTTWADLATKISVEVPANGVLLQITAEDRSPKLAADIANEVTASLSTFVGELSPSTKGPTPVKVTRASPALVPTAPFKPSLPIALGVGLLAGLAVGLAIAMLRDVLDTRIRSDADIELVTDKPIIGGIGFDPSATARPLVVQTDPRSTRAESFRSLRMNVHFLGMGKSGRVFVVTSSLPSEGKSTTAANLAISTAEAGARVLLVDADLRRPKLATYLGLDGDLGLSEVLIGEAELDDVLQPWGGQGLSVLASGHRPPNPSELLQSEEMDVLLEKLRGRFDIVIFDTPPLLPVSDAALLSHKASGAIVVCAATRTHRGELSAAIEILNQVEAKVLGIVLTMIPSRGPYAAGYSRYGYGYDYGTPEAT